MNESNTLGWAAVGLAAVAALYFKGYLRVPNLLNRARVPPTPDQSKALAGLTSAQLVYLAAVEAKKEAERDVSKLKADELYAQLLAHFKSPFSAPPAGPPQPPGPPAPG